MNRFFASTLAGALSAGVVAAPASAGCWDAPQLSAARTRDFQTMLMASTLRCRAAGHDVAAHYNAFVAARRAELAVANAALRARYDAEGGARAFDRFATSLANAYGAGPTSTGACDEIAQTADDAAESTDALFQFVDQRSDPPQAAGGLCAVGAPAQIASEAAPAGVARDTPRPEEVAAARDVLSRYAAAQGMMAR